MKNIISEHLFSTLEQTQLDIIRLFISADVCTFIFLCNEHLIIAYRLILIKLHNYTNTNSDIRVRPMGFLSKTNFYQVIDYRRCMFEVLSPERYYQY